MRLRGPEGQTAAVRCKKWDCPDCGPWKWGRLEDAIHAAVEEHPDLTRFFTLTLDPKARRWDVGRQVARMSDARNRFLQALKRRFGGERPKLIWVLELHKDGTPHLHGLVDRYIPQSWLSRKWDRAGGGAVVDIRSKDSHRAAEYLTKYLTKSQIAAEYLSEDFTGGEGGVLPKGTRRYGTSGGVALVGVYPGGNPEWGVEIHDGEAWIEPEEESLRVLFAVVMGYGDRPPPWAVRWGLWVVKRSGVAAGA